MATLSSSLKPTANSHKSDYLITNRRRDEDARNRMLETTMYYARAAMKSQFEESTNLAIRRKHILRRFAELSTHEEAKLESRREKLRLLMEQDEEKYKQELSTKEDTTESRVAAMRTRMNELRDQREKERKVVVEQKLLQRWRKEADELRQLESKMLEKQVAKERASQLVEREQRRHAEIVEKQYYAELWEKDRLKKIEREEADKAYQKKINESMMVTLREQLKALQIQAQKEVELKHDEARLMREEHENRILEDERRHQRKLQEQRIIRQELDSFNKMKIQQRQKDVNDALEMDMKILNEFLRQEAQDRENKARRREELRKEMSMYRDHLSKIKREEKEREVELEMYYSQEQERSWKVKMEKWRKEQAARDKLMTDVMEGRRQQIREALERNKRAQDQVRLEKQQIEQNIIQTRKEEDLRRIDIATKKKDYSDVLAQQIEAVHQRKLDEKKRHEDEDQSQLALNRLYEEILARELARVRDQ